MIELSEEQCAQLRIPEPLAINPLTQQTYVLVPESIYRRFRSMLGDEGDVLATGEMVDRLMAEDDANDPYLESYQSYVREAKK